MSSERPAVAVVGLGLIGGSLALRLSQSGYPVTAYDTDRLTREEATAAGLDCAVSLPGLLKAVPDGGIVVLSVPLPVLVDLLPVTAEHTATSVTVTDTASVKSPVRAAAVAAGLASRFVGAHPMAGTTDSGFGNADPTMLDAARWVVALEQDTDVRRWLQVAALITSIDGTVAPATSVAHDQAVAWISHLPHVLAEALAAGAPSELALGLAAGSFRDATRVALTRPELVAAMLTGNADAVGHSLDVLIAALQEARSGIGNGGVGSLIADGYAVRSDWPRSADRLVPMTIDIAAADAVQQLLVLGAAGGYVVSIERGQLTGLTSPGSQPQ